jgi:hypothetical protein
MYPPPPDSGYALAYGLSAAGIFGRNVFLTCLLLESNLFYWCLAKNSTRVRCL